MKTRALHHATSGEGGLQVRETIRRARRGAGWVVAALIGVLAAGGVRAADPGEPGDAGDGGDGEVGAVGKRDPKIYERQLAWHRETLLKAYETVGRRDDRWDRAVLGALETWAVMRADGARAVPDGGREVREGLKAAVTAGCDDPLVGYLSVRFRESGEEEDPIALGRRASDAALRLDRSDYGEWLKFYGHLRAAQASTNAALRVPEKASFHWGLASLHRRAANSNLVAVLRDGKAPIEEVYIAVNELLAHVKSNPAFSEPFRSRLEPALFHSYPNEALAWLLKGEFRVAAAWSARGTGTADKVTEAGHAAFEQRLREADEALLRAWDLNPRDGRIPRLAMRVELGLGRGRKELETWFDRAMTLDPSDREACDAKMYYLEPKWHGTPAEMIAFGRQCVAREEWGGRVPLVLVNAHERLARYLPADDRSGYWRRPGVWEDLKAGYDAYFARNPGARKRSGPYARHAFWCGRWDEFLEQVELLRESYRHSFFGGKEAYDRMVREAREKSKTKTRSKTVQPGG